MVKPGTLKCCSFCTLVLAVLMLVFGIFLIAGFSALSKFYIKSQFYLGQSSDGTLNLLGKNYIDPPYDMKMEYYFYDVLNSNDVINNGDKPQVKERGPYAYKEVQKKKNWNFEGEKSIYFYNHRYYYFDKKLSCDKCSESDLITVPNVILAGLAPTLDPQLESFAWYKKEAANALLVSLGELPFVRQSVKDLLYNGYSDRILMLAQKNLIRFIIDKQLKEQDPNADIDQMLPKEQKRMGFTYGFNGSHDGHYKVNTGKGDVSKLGMLEGWQGPTMKEAATELPWWSTKEANILTSSTDGSLYHPFVEESDVFNVFSSALCRSIPIKMTAKNKFNDKLDTLIFQSDPNVFDSSLEINAGYKTDLSELSNKLLDVSHCLPGHPPVAVSIPHDMITDKDVTQGVSGSMIVKDGDFAVAQIEIEPLTGVTLSARTQAQINVLMYYSSQIGTLRNINGTKILPALWMQETAMVDPHTLSELEKIGTFKTLALVAGIVLMVLALIFVGGAIACWKTSKNSRTSPLNSSYRQSSLPMPSRTPPEERSEKGFETKL